MQEKLEHFFAQVQALAERTGVTAYVVAAVVPSTPHDKNQVQIASHASSQYEHNDTLNVRCCDAMADSVEIALDRLAGGDEDEEPVYKN